MAVDILLDSEDQMVIEDGDLKFGFSDFQHIDHIIRIAPGEVKDFPLLGVDILSYVNAPTSKKEQQKLKKEVRLQLLSDGAQNISVSYTDTLNVEAEYGG